MATDLDEEISRAEQAAMILNHPIYVEAFEKLEKEVLDAWISSPSRDAEGRESLWLSLKLLRQTRAHMESLVTTGRMADVQLSRRGAR